VRDFRSALLSILVLVLAGCGGGSGSGSSAPPPPPNQAPSAAFSASPTVGPAPLQVRFDAGASTDPDGSIAAYQWDFGDGTEGSGVTVTHVYRTAGTYRASLTVRDDDGASAQAGIDIEVEPSYTLSGTIRILASSAVDSDVNDPNAVHRANDGFDDAQPIPVPATVGGYVAVAGAGETGAVGEDGDRRDVFAVSLEGRQSLLLATAEPEADLDLYLYDAERELLDASINPAGETDSLRVDAAGMHFVEVRAAAGASNYVLSVGVEAQASATGLRLSAEFEAGEIVAAAVEAMPDRVDGRRLLWRRGRLREAQLLALENGGEAPGEAFESPIGAQIPAATRRRLATLRAAKALARAPGVRFAEPNFLRHPAAVPNDPFYRNQWHYDAISLPAAWDLSTGSEAVIVAVIDTGVLLGHPDLAGRLVAGYDFISSASRAGDGDGIDPDPDDPGDGEPEVPSSFHGTHIAGTVAAASNNGIGVAGVAWSGRVMPLRALGVGGGTTYDVIQSIRFAAGLSNDSGTVPDQRADVINLSLGGEGFSRAEADALRAARAAGVIVVAAAGNESSSEPFYPAAHEGVVAVSATTITRELASYSNRGSWVDLAAPGGSVRTDINGDGFGDGVVSTIGDDSGGSIRFRYGILNGTSMAAPHVAGVAALMKSVHPALGPDEFDAALRAGLLTDDGGDPGRDDFFGFGIVNAARAVRAAIEFGDGSANIPARLAAVPGILSFGVFTRELEVVLQNNGGDELAVSGVEPSVAWITVEEADVAADGTGRYRVSVNREQLADGLYRGTLVFRSSVNDARVDVVMQVSSLDEDADAGFHYVLLLDAATGEAVAQVESNAERGEYPFRFEAVAAGNYRIIAGSDADNDFLICDAGEACGAYQTLDAPQTIRVGGDLTGLDFASGFLATFTDAGAASERREDRGLRRLR